MRIRNGRILTPGAVLHGHELVVAEGRIRALRRPGADGGALLDAQGLWVAPGLIDLHVHGALGCDVMDATPASLTTMARHFARRGITSWLPTTMSASPAAIAAALANVAACPQPADGAQHLGLHIEGPYLNPAWRGAQAADALRLPDPQEYGPWLRSGVVRLITLAPELPGADRLIDAGRRQGVEFAIGHSGADYETVLAAAARGLRQATHVCNGMAGLHHRRPGTLGAVLDEDRILAQLIGDGLHVHPAVMRLLLRAKGQERVLLISDAMRATGLGDGEFESGGQTVTVRAGEARTPDGALAGSTLTLDEMLRRVMQHCGLALPQALPLASTVPAAALGLTGRKGVLQPGADADLILLDDAARLRLTMVAGRVVYDARYEGDAGCRQAGEDLNRSERTG